MCEITKDAFSVIVFVLKQKNSYFPKGLSFLKSEVPSQGFNVKAVLIELFWRNNLFWIISLSVFFYLFPF